MRNYKLKMKSSNKDYTMLITLLLLNWLSLQQERLKIERLLSYYVIRIFVIADC